MHNMAGVNDDKINKKEDKEGQCGNNEFLNTEEEEEVGLFAEEMHDSEEEEEIDEFIHEMNENEAIKLQIFKLNGKGQYEQIWDMAEYIEYNKEKTGQFIKFLER